MYFGVTIFCFAVRGAYMTIDECVKLALCNDQELKTTHSLLITRNDSEQPIPC